MKRVIFEEQETSIMASEIAEDTNVGFIEGKTKGYVVYTGSGFKAISTEGTTVYCNVAYGSEQKLSISDAIRFVRAFNFAEFFVFPTRKELYKWLSE